MIATNRAETKRTSISSCFPSSYFVLCLKRDCLYMFIWHCLNI